MRERKWVGGHRAVYFDVRLRDQHESLRVEDNAEILFDFQSAQLYVTSPLRLWRDGGGSWLTNDDFNSVLKSIERAEVKRGI